MNTDSSKTLTGGNDRAFCFAAFDKLAVEPELSWPQRAQPGFDQSIHTERAQSVVNLAAFKFSVCAPMPPQYKLWAP